MRFITVILFTALVAAGFAQSGMQGTFWLGTSLMYETPYEARQGYTFAFGLAPIVIDRPGNNNDAEYGLAAEGIFYQDRQPRGMAFLGRVGLVDGGFYAAPGILYVARPRDTRKIAFRAGILAPLGDLSDGNLLPWTLEVGAGFRF